MSQIKTNKEFSADNTAKLKEIEIKQKNTPICPDIDYIERNVEIFCRMSSQFYNPEVQEALTCLLQTFITKYKNKDPKLKDYNELTLKIQDFFSCKRGDEVLQNLTLRTVDTSTGALNQSEQTNQLINEAYVGIKYLNDLRAITPSFKYIYVILTHKGVPYIIEESLDKTKSLANTLSLLPANEIGVKSVKSIILQLLTAVHYASKVDVSNFPMEIVVRPVENAMLPIYMNHSVIYINTYGYIPVFQRYHTAGSQFENGVEHPKALYQDQDEIFQYIMSTLNTVNPALAENIVFKCNGKITIDFFNEIIQSRSSPRSTGFTILSCNSSDRLSSCMELKEIIRYFKIPFSRLDTYVKSGINRIDDLRNTLNNLGNDDIGIDQAFIITPVIVRYSQLLQNVARKVDERSQKRLFEDNLDFVDESAKLSTDQYKNQRYIKMFLNGAIERGQSLQVRQRNMTLPDFSTRQGLLTAIQNFRVLMVNIYYYETTNAIVDNYRQNIGVYQNDLIDAINEAEFIKERFEIAFANNPQVIEKFIDVINNDDDAILVDLYDTFIQDIQDPLETILHNYEVRKSPNELAKFNQEIYIQKILTLDPIPLLGI